MTRRVFALLAFCALVAAPLCVAGEAKANFTKVTIGRGPWEVIPNATAAVGGPATLLKNLNGRVAGVTARLLVPPARRWSKPCSSPAPGA